MKRAAIRPRSRKREALYAGPHGRRAFVAQMLYDAPYCVAKWPRVCTTYSAHVHEYVPRGRGGAILPGSKADAQGQRFMPVCAACHRVLTDHPAEAVARGLLQGRNK
jgi:hypothetical protein